MARKKNALRAQGGPRSREVGNVDPPVLALLVGVGLAAAIGTVTEGKIPLVILALVLVGNLGARTKEWWEKGGTGIRGRVRGRGRGGDEARHVGSRDGAFGAVVEVDNVVRGFGVVEGDVQDSASDGHVGVGVDVLDSGPRRVGLLHGRVVIPVEGTEEPPIVSDGRVHG